MTDSEILEHIKAKFIAKIESIATLPDFFALLRNITKLKIKNFIKSGLQDDADERRDIFAVKEIEKADEIEQIIIPKVDEI